jgi:hypothetical protein
MRGIAILCGVVRGTGVWLPLRYGSGAGERYGRLCQIPQALQGSRAFQVKVHAGETLCAFFRDQK